MSVLLRLDDRAEQSDVRYGFPLARYAAEHWVAHAQDEKVSSCLRKAMEYLFDVDKPYFAAWLQLHDIDTYPQPGSSFYTFTVPSKTGATPLYYAALCGFRDLVEHLTVNNPEEVHVTGGHYVTPLVAALAQGHFQTAKFLIDNGADPNVRGSYNMTPLLSAAFNGDFEMVQVLLKYKADINAGDRYGENALHNASNGSRSEIGPSLANVAQLLLKHGADVNARTDKDKAHSIPLHIAANYGRVEVVHVLLQHGADVCMEDGGGRTALQLASDRGHHEIMKLLSEHRAG